MSTRITTRKSPPDLKGHEGDSTGLGPVHPFHCPGHGVYVHKERGRVCLGCGALLAPGAAAWVAQPVRECAPGLHQWGPRPADDTPRQCRRCPAVERNT